MRHIENVSEVFPSLGVFTQPLVAGNAGWPVQFRYRGGRHPPRVPELDVRRHRSYENIVIHFHLADLLLMFHGNSMA